MALILDMSLLAKMAFRPRKSRYLVATDRTLSSWRTLFEMLRPAQIFCKSIRDHLNATVLCSNLLVSLFFF